MDGKWVSHGLDLEYCKKSERCGTRHGRLVLSIKRPCSVSSAAATCAHAAPLNLDALTGTSVTVPRLQALAQCSSECSR